MGKGHHLIIHQRSMAGLIYVHAGSTQGKFALHPSGQGQELSHLLQSHIEESGMMTDTSWGSTATLYPPSGAVGTAGACSDRR